MKDTFEDFRSFDSLETARLVLLDLLDENGIPYEITTTKSESEFITGKMSWINPVAVKIRPEDFRKVGSLLEGKADEGVENDIEVPTNYYLNSLNDNELLEILQKPDEWGKDDYAIARKILQKRGRVFSKEQLLDFRKKRLEFLAKPEPPDEHWLVWAFAGALAGGVIGIFIGYTVYKAKKVLPDGRRVFTYDADTRLKGRLIFLTGIIVFFVSVVVFLMGVVFR